MLYRVPSFGDKKKSNKTFKCEKKIFSERNIKVDKAKKGKVFSDYL